MVVLAVPRGSPGVVPLDDEVAAADVAVVRVRGGGGGRGGEDAVEEGGRGGGGGGGEGPRGGGGGGGEDTDFDPIITSPGRREYSVQ